MTMPRRFASQQSQRQDFSQWFWPYGLLLISLLVLATPLVLWGAFWLRMPWSFILVGAIGAAFWFLPRRGNVPFLEPETRHELVVTALWAFAPLALLSLVSGIGGIRLQSDDWFKHNAVLADLVRSDWPVRYMQSTAPVHLTYYTAFYLPAALIGKVAGWKAALAMHQFGSLVVLGLVSAWLSWIMGARARWIGFLFAAFGGVDYFAEKLVEAWHGQPLGLQPFSLEWWEKPMPWWGYLSHTTEMFWVPHAALTGWLAGVILLRAVSPLNSKRGGSGGSSNWSDISFDVVLCAFMPLWSPWAWLGALPLLAVRVVQQLLSRRRMALWPWLFLIGLWVMQFGYLMSRIPLPAGVMNRVGLRLTFTAFKYIQQYGVGTYIGTLVAFMLVEFGIYTLLCLLLWRVTKTPSPIRPFLWASVLTLAFFPLFHYGLYNDLMRSAATSLVVVCLACAAALKTPRTPSALPFKGLLVLGLCFGSLHSAQYAINVIHDTKVDLRSHHSWLHQPALRDIPTVYELFARDSYHHYDRQLLTQYIGRDDTTWARWFLKS